jgi:lysophospholipid hydrolase
MSTVAHDPSLPFISFPELVQGLSDSTRQELSAQFERVHLASGETLIRQGERADCLYLLVTGRLRAYVERGDGSAAVVGEVGRGEVVGEMALLIDEPRSATIRAIRDSELLRLSKEAFDRFIEKYPFVMKQIARVTLMRLRRSILSSRVETAVATIAIIPAGRGAPLRHFAESLARALGAFGPTLHLNQERFERGFEEAAGRAATASDGGVAAWLNEQESKYRYVVYESDGGPSEWTRRCVRQADHILAVGLAGSDPALGEAESIMQPSGGGRLAPRRDLVLLHRAGTTRPTGTLAWLSVRQLDGHHHVRSDCAADYDRIARFVSGRAVGLVLGGGGARGMAHIGAIRAIQELGIPIDLIGGTSSGAIIAGMLANGLHCEAMQDFVRRLATRRSLLDFTLPFVSLASGRRITRAFQRVYEEVMIEDLWLNYFCVSTNLTRSSMVVHRHGLLRRGIRASVSLPGILPPVLQDHDLLVDGGLMNRLPVDVMRGLCNGGKVLAVSVNTLGGPSATDGFGEHLSGWGVLYRRLKSFKAQPEALNIASILLWSTLVKSAQSQESLERDADVCVQVPAAPIGLFDFRSFDAIVEAGYQAALEHLRGWSASEAASWTVCGGVSEVAATNSSPVLSEAFHSVGGLEP